MADSHASPALCLYWLHGLGASGADFAQLPACLQLPQDVHLHAVFPDAPLRPVTANGGIGMRSWYDIADWTSLQEDATQLDATIAAVWADLDRLAERYPRALRILGGFSQGGAVVLSSLLKNTVPSRLHGAVALSTYLPKSRQVVSPDARIRRDVPVFMAHGYWDPILPYALGEEARDCLSQLGWSVTWQADWMAHQVSPLIWQRLSEWLLRLPR